MNRRKKKNGRRSAQSLVVMIVILGAMWFASAIRARDEANAAGESRTAETTRQTDDTIAVPGGEQMLAVVTNPNLRGVDVEYAGMIMSFNPSMHVPNLSLIHI